MGSRFLREAAKKVIFLVAWPLRGARAGPLRKKNFFEIFFLFCSKHILLKRFYNPVKICSRVEKL